MSRLSSYGLPVNAYGSFAGKAGVGDISGVLTGAEAAVESAVPATVGHANAYVTGSPTLEQLDSISSSIDALPLSLDDPSYLGPSIAAGDATFDSTVNALISGAQAPAEAGVVDATNDVDENITGAGASVQSGVVSATTGSTRPNPNLGSLKPTGLHGRDYGSFYREVDIALVGASTTVEAGVVSTSVQTVEITTQMGPHGLTSFARDISPKQQDLQNVDVDLIGVGVEFQFGVPNSASTSIFIDGVAVAAESGDTGFSIGFIDSTVSLAAAGTVSISVDIDASPSGASADFIAADSAGIGGGTGDIGVTPLGAAAVGVGADPATAFDWVAPVTGGIVYFQAAEVGIDLQADVSATIQPASVIAQADDPALAGPHVSANVSGVGVGFAAGDPLVVYLSPTSSSSDILFELGTGFLHIDGVSTEQDLVSPANKFTGTKKRMDID